MTSFFRQAHEDEWGSLVWELRTVNHRYLDISLRCPDLFREQEMAFRECVQKHLARGKVEATLKFMPGPKFTVDFSVNEPLLHQLAEANTMVSRYFPDATANTIDLLSWKGVLNAQEVSQDALNQTMLSLLDRTLHDLVGVRQREGEGIRVFLLKHTDAIKKEASKIEQQLPEIQVLEREKLIARLSTIMETLDTQRLEQEMLLWAQRADVSEELQRLNAHLQEVERVLKQGGVMGRRLDFLMQELNREANTLSSKSMNALMTQSAVEMKVLIEQMREQVQNIE